MINVINVNTNTNTNTKNHPQDTLYSVMEKQQRTRLLCAPHPCMFHILWAHARMFTLAWSSHYYKSNLDMVAFSQVGLIYPGSSILHNPLDTLLYVHATGLGSPPKIKFFKWRKTISGCRHTRTSYYKSTKNNYQYYLTGAMCNPKLAMCTCVLPVVRNSQQLPVCPGSTGTSIQLVLVLSCLYEVNKSRSQAVTQQSPNSHPTVTQLPPPNSTAKSPRKTISGYRFQHACGKPPVNETTKTTSISLYPVSRSRSPSRLKEGHIPKHQNTKTDPKRPEGWTRQQAAGSFWYYPLPGPHGTCTLQLGSQIINTKHLQRVVPSSIFHGLAPKGWSMCSMCQQQ